MHQSVNLLSLQILWKIFLIKYRIRLSFEYNFDFAVTSNYNIIIYMNSYHYYLHVGTMKLHGIVVLYDVNPELSCCVNPNSVVVIGL